MEYKKAAQEQAGQIFQLVQHTIHTIYPKYYPAEVVDFFGQLHCQEHIMRDIKMGYVSILSQNGRLVGTGSCKENHITRVFITPEYQGNGYGTLLIQNLELEIAKRYDTVCLDSSLPASIFYEKSGYKTVRHERCLVENNAVLVYEIMEKKL